MDTDINTAADVFKALGDPNRLKILNLIASYGNRLCVGMIAGKIGITQPAVSQHLKVLKTAGLVEAEKAGFYMHYAIRADTLDGFGIKTIDFLKSLGTGFNPDNPCELMGQDQECGKIHEGE
ncbi:MAG: helix-turn-helix transcriptional regulator [Spirochaetales bacterium]|nr:helix-turn-helix transcriptional regulator [Spirochaetales bacterium]